MNDGCGASSFGLFGTADALGSSLKTSVGSCLSRMRPGWFVTWSERGSRFGLFYSEPTMSAPRTGGTESGSSVVWSSPMAGDAKTVGYRRDRGTKGLERPALLGQARQWPTPRSEDSEQTGAHRGEPDTLTSAARLWPTPNSHDAERGAESKATKDARGSGGVNLREACNWPTPQTVDAKITSRPPRLKIDRQTRDASTPGSYRGDLADVVNWPTPKSRDVKGMSQRGTHKPEDALLNMVNAGLPAPASPSTNGKRRDWCTPGASLAEAGTQSRGGDRKNELLLNGQARAESPRAGSLNPDWVSQLVGLPADWCHLPDEVLCALLETSSSPKSRK